MGAAFPCLLHPDGSLQDAGVLLAKDGTVLVYGDGDDPQRLCYRFRRFVDTGTAACLLIRRATFNALGGFDERYAPAYYEDVDLCMRLAQRGLRVVYEPRALVTHERYGSSTTAQAAELSERNRATFVERWGSELVGRPGTFRRVDPAGGDRRPRRDGHAAGAHLRIDRAPGAPARWPRRSWPDGRRPASRGPRAPARTRRRGIPTPGFVSASRSSASASRRGSMDRLFHYDLVVLDPGSAGVPEARAGSHPAAGAADRAGRLAADFHDQTALAELAVAGIAA